ncbi:MAG: ATP-binding cassette domain-containing protein [Bacteroidetes bacterium]|nr:ATP-binding cassette domain-containing protein [Bacteroidota bacterium]
MLQLYSVSKFFGKREVIKHISFALDTGDILGIYGRNGCGKSTLLKTIHGTLAASDINLTYNKIKVYPKDIITNKIIAYVPQHPFLPKNTKVRDLIPIYFAEEKEQDILFYDEIIKNFTAKRVHELSIGQRKYLEVILVSYLPHPFLFLDEPFSMLEPLQIERLKKHLLSLKKHKGLLITDHYYADVLEISTKHMIIHDGIGIPITSKDDLVTYQYLSKF